MVIALPNVDAHLSTGSNSMKDSCLSELELRCTADTGDCTRLLIYRKQDKLVPTIADTV
jgi:hypothetical protein